MIIVEYDSRSCRCHPLEVVYLIHEPSVTKPYPNFTEAAQRVADKFNLDFTEAAQESLEPAKRFAEKLERQLTVLYWALKGEWNGKRILDLGCGSAERSYDVDMFGSIDFAPWLGRFLTAFDLGAQIVGVDIGISPDEDFEHQGLVDLRVPDSLSFLPDKSIDVAHSSQLYTSPQLQRMVEGRVSGQGSMVAGNGLAQSLLPQLERVLKPEAYYVYFEDTKYLRTSAGGHNPPRFPTLDQYPQRATFREMIDWDLKRCKKKYGMT